MNRNTRIVLAIIGVLVVCGILCLGYGRFILPAIGLGPVQTINVGDIFTVEQEENPGTGYSWTVEYDQSKLQLVKDQANPPATQLPGSPNKHVWEFRAIARGRTKVTFSYARSWETVKPEKVVEYTLRIK